MNKIQQYFDDHGIDAIFNTLAGRNEELVQLYVQETIDIVKGAKDRQSNYVKQACYALYYDFEPREKFTGFEKLIRLDHEFRKKAVTNIDGLYGIPTVIEEVLEKVEGSYLEALKQSFTSFKSPVLYLSGGVDSEFVALAMLEADVKFTPVIFQWTDDAGRVINLHDITYAIDFCVAHNLSPVVRKVNLEKLWKNLEFIELAKQTGLSSPQLNTYVYMVELMQHEFPESTHVFGGEVRYQNLISAEEEKVTNFALMNKVAAGSLGYNGLTYTNTKVASTIGTMTVSLVYNYVANQPNGTFSWQINATDTLSGSPNTDNWYTAPASPGGVGGAEPRFAFSLNGGTSWTNIPNVTGATTICSLTTSSSSNSQTFNILLRNNSSPQTTISSSITLVNTFITLVTGSTNSLRNIGTGSVTGLPAEATWLAFKILGAGGSGGGPDYTASNGWGGGGGAGSYVEGIVRLPATAGTKTLYVGLGGPGLGLQTKGSLSINETGGQGFAFSNTWPTNAQGTGGLGLNDVGANESGGAGAGGGSTYIYYDAVPVAQAGGGGGGGGNSFGAGAQSFVINANGNNRGTVTTIPTGIASMIGASGVASGSQDGGAGGAGGGGAGVAGVQGVDNVSSSTGGSAGYAVQNSSLTWNYYAAVNTARVGTQGAVSTPSGFTQPISGVYFGKGGLGANGAYGYSAAHGGVQGAVAAYWTNSLIAPTMSSVPSFQDPVSITVSLPPAGNYAGTVTLSWSNNGTGWCTPYPGIGEFYEIYVTYGPPTSGTTGTLYTNYVMNAWNAIWPETAAATTDYAGIFGTNGDGYLNFTVTIRRKATGTTYGPVTYQNVGDVPAPPPGG